MSQYIRLLFERKIFQRGLILFIVFAAVASASFFGSDLSDFAFKKNISPRYSETPRTHRVVLTVSGFSPDTLQVLEGDSVVFETEKEEKFWPASDPHPTHTAQAGFDPGRPLLSEEQWSFTFKNPGVWRYHDHLAPSLRGSVVVTGKTNEVSKTLCSYDQEYSKNLLCFEEEVREAMARGGIDAAWKVFERLYEEGRPPQTCHWTAHFIGEEAYKLFKAGKEITIGKGTSYCGYGFFHGFLELLLRENPDPKNALRFCEKVNEKLGDMGLQNCYHGIGHGYTEDPPDPLTEGNFKAMVNPGVAVCESLFGGSFANLNLCLTGVFTVPAGFAAKKEHGLLISAENPFRYCEDQPYRYLKACYGEFAPKLDVILDWDLRRLPAYVGGISDEKLKQLVTWVVPSVMMARDVLKADHSSYITACRKGFISPLREVCWGGAILGFFQHGRPEHQYEMVLNFCASASWNPAERGFCYGEGFRRMRIEYDAKKVGDICRRVPEQYQSLCFDEKKEHQNPYSDPSFETL